MRRTRLWPVLLAAGIGVAILCSLGVWQVKRLAWKEGLIAEIDQRMSAEPVPLDEALEKFLAGQRIAYMKVSAKGRYSASRPLRLLSSSRGAPAWELIQGFEQDRGSPVLVNRGKLPTEAAIPSAPSASVEIIGLLVWHDQGRGQFDVDNKPDQNIWTWWDVVAMSNQFPATHVDPNYAVIHLLPGSPGTEGLQVDVAKANLRNNHLGYAITWFGLAAALIGVTGVFIWRQSKVTE